MNPKQVKTFDIEQVKKTLCTYSSSWNSTSIMIQNTRILGTEVILIFCSIVNGQYVQCTLEAANVGRIRKHNHISQNIKIFFKIQGPTLELCSHSNCSLHLYSKTN